MRTLPVLVDALAGFQCQSVKDPSLQASFPPGDVVSEITSGGCSCSLYAARPSGDKRRARYRAKGWSARKIERALTDAHAKTPDARVRLRDAIARFVGSTGSLRILAHLSKGGTETIIARRASTMSLADYLARDGTYDKDVLYDLRPG